MGRKLPQIKDRLEAGVQDTRGERILVEGNNTQVEAEGETGMGRKKRVHSRQTRPRLKKSGVCAELQAMRTRAR